jgi:hypothetical protein
VALLVDVVMCTNYVDAITIGKAAVLVKRLETLTAK